MQNEMQGIEDEVAEAEAAGNTSVLDAFAGTNVSFDVKLL